MNQTVNLNYIISLKEDKNWHDPVILNNKKELCDFLRDFYFLKYIHNHFCVCLDRSWYICKETNSHTFSCTYIDILGNLKVYFSFHPQSFIKYPLNHIFESNPLIILSLYPLPH